MQPLVVTDSRQIPDSPRLVGRVFTARSMSCVVEPMRNHGDAISRHVEVRRHIVSVVIVERDKRVDVTSALTKQRPGLLVMRSDEFLEKDVLARQRANDWRATL